MRSSLFAIAGTASTAMAAAQGFNYASQGNTQTTFESMFTTAQGLQTTSGWNSARLYTMIQDGTTNTVISAIPAAIATQTYLLLGLWASEDQSEFDNELTALKDAISQYGTNFTDLVQGISVGSEDLYRISPTGIAADSGVGQEPDVLVDYIGQVRDAIAGTDLSAAPVGHVDTWNVYVNASNAAVIAAADFLGLDEYPYYQTTDVNSIGNASYLFFSAYDKVTAVAGDTPIWITESGWPVSGPTENLAVASTDNAETYWKAVACELLERDIPVWWYILNDSGSSPSFGVETAGTEPLYNLSCPSVATSSSAAATSSSATATSSVAAATTPTTAATSTTLAISAAVPSTGFAASSVSSAQISSAASAVSSALASASASSVAAAGTTSGVATSVVPVTTSTATSVASDGETMTVYSTTLITITSCGSTISDCPTSGLKTVSAATSVTAAAASTVTPSGTASASGCPADINGAFQYPHLIVPINSSSPNTAYGTQYDGTVTPTVSTIFTFDIPASYANKTCSTVFLFPELDQLETSSYTFNGKGGFTIAILNGNADEQTTYANAPAVAEQVGEVTALESGNSYTLSQDSCPGGTKVSFEVTSTGGLDLEWFEDYNPSPLGLYVRAC